MIHYYILNHQVYNFILLARMLQKSQSSSEKQKQIAKSCNQKLEEDVVSQNSFERHPNQNVNEYVRGARTYISRDEADWDQLSENQKIQFKQQMKKNLSKPQTNYHKKGKMFTDEIIVSQSVSIPEDLSEGNNFRDQRLPYNEKKQEIWFNVMLIGATGTGKTTFMQCFLRQYKQKNNQTIKKHTEQIHYEKVSPNFTQPSLNMTLLDTPGYDISSISSFFENIKEQIITRMTRYQEQVKETFTQSAIYNREEKKLVDSRIHCVLFFMRGPRLYEEDWILLSKLQNHINIIPLIAKGDVYTEDQIKQLKKLIFKKSTESQIKWFGAEEYLRQNYPGQLKLLLEGPFGRAPPFVIASSTSQVEEGKILRVGRQFKWGTCFIEDSTHTDFVLLNRMLIRLFRDPLIKLTQIKCKNMMQRIRWEEKRKGLKKYVGFGIGAVVVSALMYKFKEQIFSSRNLN